MSRPTVTRGLLALLVGMGVASGSRGEEPAGPEPSFALGFAGPSIVTEAAGTKARYRVVCELTTAGLEGFPDGAQGWSLGVAAEGGSIVGATTDGTIVDELLDEGEDSSFRFIELTSGPGNEGLIAATVLSFKEDIALPPAGTVPILAVTVEADVPEPGVDDNGDPECVPAASRVYYRDGLRGSGQVVNNRITHRGLTYVPEKGEIVTSVCPALVKPLEYRVVVVSPRSAAGDIEDGARAIAVDVPVGAATQAVLAGVRLRADLPESPPDPSYPANLGGPQGWSLSVSAEPCFQIASATTEGTEAMAYFAGGFDNTELVDPAKLVDPDGEGPLPPGPQGPGAVSAVVLSFKKGNTLPPKGDFLVLKLEGTLDAAGIEAPGDSGPPCLVSVVPAGESGLAGAGQPVSTAVTVKGASRKPAVVGGRLSLLGATIPHFVRGNANNDLKSNIADAVWIINELLRGGQPTACRDAADANDDGQIDTSDAVWILSYQFQGGPAPPAPFPGCGTDPTEDELGCDESQLVCP